MKNPKLQFFAGQLTPRDYFEAFRIGMNFFIGIFDRFDFRLII
jgi:hypothetical protein